MRRFLRVLALIAVVLPGMARAQFESWPPEGKPYYVGPGDELGLRKAELGGITWLSWLSRGPLVDTLRADDLVPLSSHVSADNAVFQLFETGIGLGCPGCSSPKDLANAWIARDGGGDHLTLRVRGWATPITEVRTGGPGTLASPVVTSAFATYPESAAVLAWTEASQLHVQRVGAHGELLWNAPAGLAIGAAGAEPALLPPPNVNDNTVLVVWQDHRAASSDIYILGLQPDGTPAAGWPAGGIALEGRGEDSAHPRILRAGSAPYDATPQLPLYVLWEESGPRFGGGRSVVARKLLPDGHPDPAWPDAGVVVSSSPTVDHLEDVVYDGDLVIAWSDTRAASASNPNDLYGQRIQASGLPRAGWPADGIALCTAAGSQDHATVFSLGYLSTYAWEDRRSGESKVFVEMRNDDGTTCCSAWDNGKAAALAAGEQLHPLITSGGGSTRVYWEDGRDLAQNGHDIYVQAFQPDGSEGVVGVTPRLPDHVRIEAAPNPMHGTTQLRLELPRAANVRVGVYDVLGRLVRAIASGNLPAGPSAWTWTGVDGAGRPVAAGLYHVRTVIDGVSASRALVVLR